VAVAYYPPSRTYHRLRSVLMEELGLACHEVHPSTSLAELIPMEKRRAVWRRLIKKVLLCLLYASRLRFSGKGSGTWFMWPPRHGFRICGDLPRSFP
jgi:hypothetical protein